MNWTSNSRMEASCLGECRLGRLSETRMSDCDTSRHQGMKLSRLKIGPSGHALRHSASTRPRFRLETLASIPTSSATTRQPAPADRRPTLQANSEAQIGVSPDGEFQYEDPHSGACSRC
jgi:hypothetical protein